MLKNVYDSNKVWFCSDLHLWHKNIIHLCKRPYDDVTEMWVDIKTKWNDKVEENHTVFIMGDFIWNCSTEKCRRILSELNGKKVLILGNHDKENAYDKSLFEHIGILEEISVRYLNDEYDGENNEFKFATLVLCHYPMLSWRGSYRGTLNIYGHAHGSTPDEKTLWNQMDVGWDIKHDLFSFDDILNEMDERLLRKKIL